MSLADKTDDMRPQDGEFALVEVDTGQPVGQAGHVIAEFDDADDVVIPPETDFERYVVYDREGSTYTRESWPDAFSEAGGADEKAATDGGLPDWMASDGRNY